MRLRCVSSLAEGADRLVAREALALGYEIQAPLPFPRETYIDDFEGDRSRQGFTDLLAKATAVLELDGTRRRAPEAYLSAGRVVLDQSDVLLALWDGDLAGGVGGTAQIVAEAEAHGMIVIIVDARRPHTIRLSQRGRNRCGRLEGRVAHGGVRAFLAVPGG